MTHPEPEIIINGINVGPGCAITLRVAIEIFASTLIESDSLGAEKNNDHEKSLDEYYLDRINDIRRAMGVIK